ncbi:hypothetical protein NQ314_015933 [Rhamnusium bicolor]|uniref:Large ribosomal subunit protein mL62 n=1 Tax=Rhamnusium bicolor TaxID=1586634 RepID=A0AAV8WY85_9CUCU|nr:hypothetical protein NQ314_015933 [Rhamnusium bicolor]
MNTLKSLGIPTYNAVYNSLFPNLLKRTVAYKSALSLNNLYPNSSLKLTTLSLPPKHGNEKFSGYIPIEELDITFSRSSGPGGQNVNKVNTKVDVRFHLQSAKWLSDEIKEKLSEKEGYLIYKSDLTRSQQLNLADCLEKIRSSVRECLIERAEPSPETTEKIRRKLERAAKERLLIKRQRSQLKNDRQAPQVVL